MITLLKLHLKLHFSGNPKRRIKYNTLLRRQKKFKINVKQCIKKGGAIKNN